MTSDLEGPAYPVVTATPGYFCLYFYREDDGGERIERAPVIAWELDRKHAHHEPYTPWASPGTAAFHGILCPDGSVFSPGHSAWDTEQEWLEDMRRNYPVKRRDTA